MNSAKDEFEYATNWMRVFVTLYQNLKWLNAYAEINELAMQKIVKKFKKEMFMSKKADVLVDDLKEFISQKKFSKRDDLVKLIQSFMRFFIANLT